MLPWTRAETVRVGIHFVAPDEVVPLDFRNVQGFELHFFHPWLMTDPGSPFLTDGAFQGMTEQQVQQEIVRGVRDRFYSIPTPPGKELNFDLVSRPVSGPQSLNVAVGEYNLEGSFDHWLGQTDLNKALENPQGTVEAAVAVDEIATLEVVFDSPEKALNAIVNVTAHEIGHLFGLLHVCAAENCSDCASGCAVATDPFDVMASATSGLPQSGWIENNIFTTVPDTQTSGNSSVSLLVKNAGLRQLGDTDLDGDVDAADLTQVLGNWTGVLPYNTGQRLWSDGDFDHDEDVDSADLTRLLQWWSGFVAAQGTATLAYDPSTGGVQVRADGDQPLTSFVLAAADDVFNADQASLPWQNGDSVADLAARQIGQSTWQSDELLWEHDLGPILPAGLSEDQLGSTLTRAAFAFHGGGGGEFQLVVIPEPAGWVLAVLAALAATTSLRRINHRRR